MSKCSTSSKKDLYPSTVPCPVGTRADALSVTCEGTDGLLRPPTGGTVTFDLFSALATGIAIVCILAAMVICGLMFSLLHSENSTSVSAASSVPAE